MNSELKKIDFYFEEAIKLSNADPSFITDRKFYELWEMVHKPTPFLCDKSVLYIGDASFKIVEEHESKKCSFIWDDNEECVALLVEGQEWIDKILIYVDENGADFSQVEPLFFEEMGLSYGERLEVIFDVITQSKQEELHIADIFNIKKSEYLTILNKMTGRYDADVLRLMQKISITSIKRLIAKAAEDIPKDELTNQLHLPLDGSYIDTVQVADDEPCEPTTQRSSSNFVKNFSIPSSTKWSVQHNLEILKLSAKFAVEAEQHYVLDFKDGELIDCIDNVFTYKISTPKDIPLDEGSVLGLFIRGVDNKIGTFMIDIYDRDNIYGRVRYYDTPENEELCRMSMFARPIRSSLTFLHSGIEHIIDAFTNDRLSPLFKELIGLDEASFIEPPLGELSGDLDESQQRVLNCAHEDKNTIVIVQGPPGTGKSKVLVDVVKSLAKNGKRILVTAPSNTAIDNICRKIDNYPLLRFGKNRKSIAPDVESKYWIGNDENVKKFVEKRKEYGGGIYAGTQVGLLKDEIVQDDLRDNGPYDVIVFDEAGMAALPEFLMLVEMGRRAILFGDHKQLPPFPLPDSVIERLDSEAPPRMFSTEKMLSASAMEWLIEVRQFPVILLTQSYRCQNPRLLRFASILFYDALVTSSNKAEYFSLPYHERILKYPSSSLSLISTSLLPEEIRQENLIIDGGKPGLENYSEALISVYYTMQLLEKYPLNEITIIAPYKRQVRLIRKLLKRDMLEDVINRPISDDEWNSFYYSSISTVDSFQGGESDAVIITYVRSNRNSGIGFVDNTNRINVAHTRCRKEMVVIGDIESLKAQANSDVFKRLERAIMRDGEVVSLTKPQFEKINKSVLKNEAPTTLPEIIIDIDVVAPTKPEIPVVAVEAVETEVELPTNIPIEEDLSSDCPESQDENLKLKEEISVEENLTPITVDNSSNVNPYKLVDMTQPDLF